MFDYIGINIFEHILSVVGTKPMSAFAEKRYAAILDVVKKEGRVVISTLMKQLDVSDMTLRRDLKRLEEQGLVVRVHGGAIPATAARFGDRLTAHRPAKTKAALKLDKFLPKQGSIYLDGSTTTLSLVDRLKPDRSLQVVTNHVETFRLLSKVPGVEPLLIGGRLDPRTDNLVGSLALRSLLAIAFDAAFFSCWAITPGHGPMELTLEDAEIKDLVASRSQSVYLAVDSSKFDVVASGCWSPDPSRTLFATDLSPRSATLKEYRSRFARII